MIATTFSLQSASRTDVMDAELPNSLTKLIRGYSNARMVLNFHTHKLSFSLLLLQCDDDDEEEEHEDDSVLDGELEWSSVNVPIDFSDLIDELMSCRIPQQPMMVS